MRKYLVGFAMLAALALPAVARAQPPIACPGGVGRVQPPQYPPRQANAIGYSTLTFYDEFNGTALDTTKWQLDNFNPSIPDLTSPSGYTEGSGWLTIETDNSGYSDGMATASPSYPDGTFQNHGYFETCMKFSPTAHVAGTAWPAFWLYDEAGVQSPPVGTTFAELDVLECYPQDPNPCLPIQTVHQWTVTTSGNTQVQNGNNVPTLPVGFDLTAWHRYGVLWQPTSVTWYIDDVAYNSVAIGPGTPYLAMPAAHMIMILGTGENWPVQYSYVHVWQ